MRYEERIPLLFYVMLTHIRVDSDGSKSYGGNKTT